MGITKIIINLKDGVYQFERIQLVSPIVFLDSALKMRFVESYIIS